MTEDRELQRMNRDARIEHYQQRASEAQLAHQRWSGPNATGTMTITLNRYAAETLTRKLAALTKAQAELVKLDDKLWDSFLTIEDETRQSELENDAETAAFELVDVIARIMLDD